MDNIKYQVFISSTYSDLMNERKQVAGYFAYGGLYSGGDGKFCSNR